MVGGAWDFNHRNKAGASLSSEVATMPAPGLSETERAESSATTTSYAAVRALCETREKAGNPTIQSAEMLVTVAARPCKEGRLRGSSLRALKVIIARKQ